MLRKSHRFHGYGSLKSVYAHGKTVRGQLLQLRYMRRDTDRPYRVAVVVSRKVHKSAVVRNRIRRRVYECVRQASQDIKPGTDLVFTVYSERIATIDSAELTKLMDGMLKKIDA